MSFWSFIGGFTTCISLIVLLVYWELRQDRVPDWMKDEDEK